MKAIRLNPPHGVIVCLAATAFSWSGLANGQTDDSSNLAANQRACELLTDFAVHAEPAAPASNPFYSRAEAHVDCGQKIYAITADVRPEVVETNYLPKAREAMRPAICATPGWEQLFEHGWTVTIDLMLNGTSVWPSIVYRNC